MSQNCESNMKQKKKKKRKKNKKKEEEPIIGIQYNKKNDVFGNGDHALQNIEIATITAPSVSQGEIFGESENSDASSKYSWNRHSKVQPLKLNTPSDLLRYPGSPPPYETTIDNGNIPNSSLNQSLPQYPKKPPEKEAAESSPTSTKNGSHDMSSKSGRLYVLLVNLTLVGIVYAYALVGGAAFVALEKQHSVDHYELFQNARTEFLQSIRDLSVCNETENLYSDRLEKALTKYEDEMNLIICHVKMNITGGNQTDQWTFWNAVFFSSTVISTIGYGNIAPVTLAGRVFCMVYAVFGIALLLLVLASLGTLFARGATLAYRKLHLMLLKARGKEHMQPPRTHRQASLTMVHCDKDDDKEHEKQTSLYKHTDDTDMRAINLGDKENEIERRNFEDGVEKDEENEDEVEIPMIIVFLFAFGYICIVAGILITWEDWGYFEAFYFSFITLTTIGFGDIVPQHQKNLLAITFFILLGMAIMSMCIALAQNAIMKKVAWASRKIGVAIIKSKPSVS